MPDNRLRDVYITAMGTFMPNDPVANEDMENYLGLVAGKPSRYKKHVLAANGIKQRYYARTRDGRQTHLNEELAANAVTAALARRGMAIDEVQMLAAATTLADLLMPSFASMVHGRLGGNPLDLISTSGICSASMTAMKAAWLALRAGEHDNAVAVGSEMASVVMKASRFEKESELDKTRDPQTESFKYFNADFLRWMLSDGAGAALLETRPNPDALSLRIDWIQYKSYANQLPTCMYMGTSRTQDLRVGDTYQSYDTFAEAEAAGLFVVRQDTSILPVGLLQSVVGEAKVLREKGLLQPDQVDHFLPHLSSYFFFDKFQQALAEVDALVHPDKWFTNLESKGNTGVASVYIMLEEALNSGRFKPGDRIVTMVPESGRFAVSYAHFTCVAP